MQSQVIFHIESTASFRQHTYPLASSARIILISFWLLVLLAHAFWEADMTAHLTRNNFMLPLNTFEELAAQDWIKPILVRGTSTYAFFQDTGALQQYSKIYSKAVASNLIFDNFSAAVDFLLHNPEHALVGRRTPLSYAALKHCDKLAFASETVFHGHSGFATLPEQNFVDALSKYLSRLKEHGVIDRLRKKWWFTVEKCTNREAEYRQINLRNSLGALIILILFICLSIIALAVELAWKTIQRRTVKAPTVGVPATAEMSCSRTVSAECNGMRPLELKQQSKHQCDSASEKKCENYSVSRKRNTRP
ncbi:Glutamate receptor 3 [Clonorchis sinensis]|uniref:Glutamate receptor 3 n=1 Tax=Clonorchis sinensis TaxID=79923 RepID=A0A3R7FMV2_CLOSI|nr:Glutamate receptor 3 [Clonorchis sinensis]